MVKHKMIRDKVSLDIYDFEGRLCNIRRYVDELEEKYGQEAQVEFEYGYEGLEGIEIHFDRKETDKERNKRLAKACKERENKKIAKAKKEEKERAELARLIKKYGEG